MTEGRYTQCQNCRGAGSIWVTFDNPTLNREEVCHWCLGDGRVLNDFYPVADPDVNNTQEGV
jgi:DnaJ-class molecular chaperone